MKIERNSNYTKVEDVPDEWKWVFNEYHQPTDRRWDGSVIFEAYAGEMLIEGSPDDEVRRKFDLLPEHLKEPPHLLRNIGVGDTVSLHFPDPEVLHTVKEVRVWNGNVTIIVERQDDPTKVQRCRFSDLFVVERV